MVANIAKFKVGDKVTLNPPILNQENGNVVEVQNVNWLGVFYLVVCGKYKWRIHENNLM